MGFADKEEGRSYSSKVVNALLEEVAKKDAASLVADIIGTDRYQVLGKFEIAMEHVSKYLEDRKQYGAQEAFKKEIEEIKSIIAKKEKDLDNPHAHAFERDYRFKAVDCADKSMRRLEDFLEQERKKEGRGA